MTLLGRAVLRTLAYADVFSYPLKEDEIERWLISLMPRRQIKEELVKLVRETLVIKKKDFYCLPGRETIVGLRVNREKASENKFIIAKHLARFLGLIPTVRMVAVTGSLAMMNAAEEDDIDLLIVAGRHRLWLTRLWVTLLTEVVAKRRRPQAKDFKNKICLNMFLEDNKLGIVTGERNLFTAHEVCQLRPLLVKGNVYQEFIKENEWCSNFLPNWKPLPASAN